MVGSVFFLALIAVGAIVTFVALPADTHTVVAVTCILAAALVAAPSFASVRVDRTEWGRNMGRTTVAALALIVVTAIAATLVDASRVAAVGALGAIATAVATWLGTSWANAHGERLKYTMTLISDYKKDKILNDHIVQVLKAYPPYKHLPPEDLEPLFAAYRTKEGWADGANTAHSIISVLNFLEFVAQQFNSGLLDEATVRAYFNTIFRTWAEKLHACVVYARRDQRSRGLMPTAYDELITMYLALYRGGGRHGDFVALRRGELPQ